MTTWAEVIDKGFEHAKGYLDRSLAVFSKRLAAAETAAERVDGLEKRLALLEGKAPTKPRVKVPAKGVLHD